MKIFVTVKTRARKTAVEKQDGSHYRVCVNAAPEKGKANAAVLEALADYWNIPKSRVEILSGHTSKQKVVAVYPS